MAGAPLAGQCPVLPLSAGDDGGPGHSPSAAWPGPRTQSAGAMPRVCCFSPGLVFTGLSPSFLGCLTQRRFMLAPERFQISSQWDCEVLLPRAVSHTLHCDGPTEQPRPPNPCFWTTEPFTACSPGDCRLPPVMSAWAGPLNEASSSLDGNPGPLPRAPGKQSQKCRIPSLDTVSN